MSVRRGGITGDKKGRKEENQICEGGTNGLGLG